MSAAVPQATITVSLTDLEALIRRVVREELARLLPRPASSIAEDWTQEGPDDPAGDALLLREALAVLDEYGDKPESWMTWEEFKAEVDRAEAGGELPD